MPTEPPAAPGARRAPPDRQNAGAADGRRLGRLRWRCRRGLLENDLILARFLDARGEAITEDEVAALDRLLDLTDNELWDLMSGRTEPADASLRPLVASLRAA